MPLQEVTVNITGLKLFQIVRVALRTIFFQEQNIAPKIQILDEICEQAGNKKGAAGSSFILKRAKLKRSGNGLLYRFHAETDTTLTIDLQYLDLDHITFGKFVSDLFYTLFTNL